jgi:hypothetical protein
MVNDLLTVLCMVSALYVLLRVIFAAAECDVRSWRGHMLRLVGLVSWRAFAAAGAVAVALGAPIGGPLLLVAVTLLFVADRRVT